jgi:hypothetical protein
VTWRCGVGNPIAGAWAGAIHPGLGVLGSEVPATGFDGPSPLYQCLSLPADANVEVRGYITRFPTNGSLDVSEDLSFVYAGTPDYLEFKLYADGVASIADVGYGPGIVHVDLLVGALNAAFGAGETLGGVVASGALICSTLGAIGRRMGPRVGLTMGGQLILLF